MGALRPKTRSSIYTGRRTPCHQSYDDPFKKIPQEISTEILARVGKKSVVDLCNARLSCKDLNKAASEDYIFEQVALPAAEKWHRSDGALSFLKRCEACGNPDALFRQGMLEFFSHRKIESGLNRLKTAALKGHVEATYVYGAILVLYGGSLKEKGLRLLASNLKMKTSSRGVVVNRCRVSVKSLVRGMWIHNHIVDDIKASSIRSTNCKACNNVKILVSNKWTSEDHPEDYDALCNSCFWDYEAKLFRMMIKRGCFSLI